MYGQMGWEIVACKKYMKSGEKISKKCTIYCRKILYYTDK